MVRPEQANWVDKAIRNTIPGKPPQPDFTAWRQAHPEALEALARRAQRKIQSDAGRPALIEFGRRIMRSPIGKLAVAAAIVLTVLGGIHYLGGSLDGTSRAFADICRNVTQASTVRFVTRSATLTAQIYEKDGYLVRTELQWPEPMPFDTMLTDKRAGNRLYMDSQRKVAWHPSGEFRDATSNIYELFTNYLHMPGYSVKKLGKERIGDRLSLGFRVTMRDEDLGLLQHDIWTDPETRLPIRIDFTGHAPDGQTFEHVTTDIVFDEPLDDALFDFEPEGFQIIDESDLNTPAREIRAPVETEPVPTKPTQEGLAASELAETDVAEPNAIPSQESPPVEPQSTITGVVIAKSTGQPIPGAEVSISEEEITVTDSQGRYELVCMRSYPIASVYAIAPGYAVRRVYAHLRERSVEDVVIELVQGSRLVGRVTDPARHPVEGAEVEAVFLPPGAQSVSTDADGQFQIEGLDPVVQAYYVQVVHPGYPRTSVSVRPAPAGQTRHEDIVLQAGATVFGQVTDPNGNSLEGVKVGNTRSPAMWNCITAYTDAQGQYRLEDVESGDLTLWAVPTRYALHVEHSAIEPGMAEKRLDIQLQEPTPLHGLVLYPPGAGGPVADVQVIISTFNGVSNLTDEGHTTGPDGRFVISNLPADGMVSFTCLGEGVHGSSQKFNIGQDKCFLTARRIGRIFGSVLADVTGQPIAPFTVKLGVSLVTRQVAGSYGIWFDEGCTFDSPLGLFDTGKAALPTGSAYRVTVQAEGYEPMIVDPVVAQPASENPNRTVFRLRPIEVLAGRVVSRDSQPIQGATVLFLSRNTGHQKEQFPRAVTDQTGVYTISGLGLGPQCLFVSAAGFAPRVCLMSDFLESPSHVGDIILDISPTIVGRVVDDNGNGILGMRVHASVDLAIAKNVVTFYPSLGPDAWTDSDGDYQLSDVPIGEVQISLIAADGYELERNRVTLEPAELSEVNFGGDGGHTVTGTVRAGDVSLENARISLRLESARRFQRKTDAEGQFRIGNVATGAYSLSILWRPGFADRPSRWPRQTLFTVDRTLHIDRNMKLEIDLEAETIEGF